MNTASVDGGGFFHLLAHWWAAAPWTFQHTLLSVLFHLMVFSTSITETFSEDQQEVTVGISHVVPFMS